MKTFVLQSALQQSLHISGWPPVDWRHLVALLYEPQYGPSSTAQHPQLWHLHCDHASPPSNAWARNVLGMYWLGR